jgi:hypothetical protein
MFGGLKLNNLTNDHELTIGSETKRLRLLRDTEGKALHNVIEEVPEYRQSLLFAQDDWTEGFGQVKTQNQSMYFDGQSIDTFTPGWVKLGPLITVYPDYYNFLEDVKQYTHIGTTYTDYHNESWSYTTNDVLLLPGAAVNDAFYFGSNASSPFTKLVINVTTAGVGDWVLAWEYWNGASWSAIASVVDNTTAFTVAGENTVTWLAGAVSGWATVAVDGDTSYWVRCRVTSCTAHGTHPLAGQIWCEYTTPSLNLGETISQFLYWPQHETYWCGAGTTTTHIYEYINTIWRERYYSTGDFKQMAIFNDSDMYIAMGATNYVYTDNGLLFEATDLADNAANYFLAAPNPAGTDTVLWKVANSNELTYTTNGKSAADGGAAWSTPAYIGDDNSELTNLLLVNDKIMIAKSDGILYHYNSNGGVETMLSGITSAESTSNYKYACLYQGSTYFTTYTILGEISSYDTFDILNLTANDKEDIFGLSTNLSMYGVTSDGQFLYVAVLESTGGTYTIYKGKQELKGEYLTWRWCPHIYLGTNYTRPIYVGVDNKLLYGYGNGLIGWSTVLGGTDYHAPTGHLQFSYVYGTNPYWDMMVQSIVTETEGCSATRTVQPKYRKNTETSWTNLTAAITTNGLVKTMLTSQLTGQRIQFRVDLTTDNSLYSPIVKLFQVLGQEVPTTVRIHECVYSLGDEPARRTSTIRTFLRGARTSTSLVKLADLRYGEAVSGTNYTWVTCMPGYPQEVEIVTEKNRQPELGVKVRWMEVNYTKS